MCAAASQLGSSTGSHCYGSWVAQYSLLHTFALGADPQQSAEPIDEIDSGPDDDDLVQQAVEAAGEPEQSADASESGLPSSHGYLDSRSRS